MEKVELLAPAGNMEKLKFALKFGADAVYLSGKSWGMRAGAGNFNQHELQEAFDIIHQAGKKGYVTVNIFAHEHDFHGLLEYIQFLTHIHVDAVIVADPGIFHLIRKHFPELTIHLSTQANVTNRYAVKFWEQAGAKRITMARELSIGEIETIARNSNIELEVFAHGAMCMAYSGRCMLSNFLTGRDANKGDCAHICRWEYTLQSVKRNDQIIALEDERGTYLFNSNDLNTLPVLDKLLDAGIKSLKIEGRMKSVHYVSIVTKAYRQAIDLYYSKGKLDDDDKAELIKEVEKTSHRNFFTGFYEKKPGPGSHNTESSKYTSDYTMVGIVKEVYKSKGVLIECRGRFGLNEKLQLITPDGKEEEIQFKQMKNILGEKIDLTKPNQNIFVPYDKKLKIYGIIAKEVKQERER
ncbi:MAG: U32 family peptidase [Calditrichia bacterium]